MEGNLNVPMRNDLPELKSAEYLSPEWVFDLPASEVSALLREKGFDPDKELSHQIRQAIKDNGQRIKRLAERKPPGASVVASCYLGMRILRAAIAATLLF